MLRPLLLALALTTPAPCLAWDWPWSSDDSAEVDKTEGVGTRKWWRKHRDDAILVPHKGYEVPGHEGYFDGNGVPINASIDEQAIRLGQRSVEPAGLLPGLDPKKAVNSMREAAGYGPDEALARQLLNDGVAAFRAEDYDQAADLFESAADRWPGTDLAAKALLNLGEAHFFNNDFDKAADAYIELLTKHPSNRRLDGTVERIFDIARHWEKWYFAEESHAPLQLNFTDSARPRMDTIGNAVRLYDAIRLNDPTGPRADDAIMATAEIHRRRNRFADADYHYTLLREEYPRSEHQFEAHLRGLQSKLLRYQGPDYDGTPLFEAEQLEQQTRATFAGRLDDEQRDRLTETRAQVLRLKEERELRMVDFYTITEHAASARYYLARFVEENPDSPAVVRAKEQLAALDGLPDAPDRPMEWLVNLFPEDDRFKDIQAIDDTPAADVPGVTTPDSGRTMVAERSDDETVNR